MRVLSATGETKSLIYCVLELEKVFSSAGKVRDK